MNTILAILTLVADVDRAIAPINAACIRAGLPLPFESFDGRLELNKDYRFEGFGFTILPPTATFWLHWKPESPEHVALGKFGVPIPFTKIFQLKGLIR